MLVWRRTANAGSLSLSFNNLPDNLRSLISLYDVAELIGTGSARADLPHH